MSNINSIKRHLTAQFAGHLVMISFALASLANVESFFAALHPGLPLLSWGLGIALGIGLVVMAGILSTMAWDWHDTRFQMVAAVAGALALLSGGIQAAAYAVHMDSWVAAVVVGLSLPVVGELGVAIAVSASIQAQRKQRMQDAQSQLADGVRAQIGEAVATLDPTKIRAQVDRAANLVTKAIVDSTIADMLRELQNGRDAVLQSVEIDAENSAKCSILQETARPASVASRPGIEALNEAKRLKIEERRATILRIVTQCGAATVQEIVARLADDFAITVSDRTAKSDLDALIEEGSIIKDGSVYRPAIAAIPAPVAVYTNGVSH